jgi:hypothetical protein
MTILALPVSPVNVKSLPAPVGRPVPAPINRPRPCDCPEAPECGHCGSSGWTVDALILAGRPIPPDMKRRELEACQRLIDTIDRMQREEMARLRGEPDDAGEYVEPTYEDCLAAAEMFRDTSDACLLDDIDPATDGPTAGMLGLMAYEAHRDQERRYQDWCEGR